MDEKVTVLICNVILPVKRNEFESILVSWMNLDSVIQSEVSQKEKHIINAYIWNLEKWY